MTRSSFFDHAFDNEVENPKSRNYRGRIPMRLPNVQKKTLQKSKIGNAEEFRKNPVHVATVQMNNRPLLGRRLRPSSTLGATSAMGLNDDVATVVTTKSARVEREKLYSAPTSRKPSTLPKKAAPIRFQYNKIGKDVITVPLDKKSNDGKPFKFLPKQETIEKYEAEIDNGVSDFIFAEEGLHTSCSDDKIQIVCWQRYTDQFEKMKKELATRQNDILELICMMRHYHDKLAEKGGDVGITLPATDDLSFMNVGLSPQLFGLSPGTKSPVREDFLQDGQAAVEELEFDASKLFNMPTKLVTVCEKAISKRKEVLDWFESLLNESNTQKQKGFKGNVLRKKIYHYKTENENLRMDLEKTEKDFFKELNGFLNMGIKETIKGAVGETTKEIKNELEKVDAENEDLKKQLRERPKSHSPCQHTKQRIEELEKELKDERVKAYSLKDRLQRVERKSKTTDQLLLKSENALQKMHTQTLFLERTVEQLNNENQEIRENFDKELTSLTASIEQNTTHLKQIAEARDSLLREKECLEEKLKSVTDTLKEIMDGLNESVQKVASLDEKYKKEVEINQNLQSEIEVLNKKLIDYENLNLEKETLLNRISNYEKDTENMKKDLDKATTEIEDLNKIIICHDEVLKEIEERASSVENTLRNDINTKNKYIAELEKKKDLLEEQAKDNETKSNLYVEQLTDLKEKILQLQEDLGNFENNNDLTEMITELRMKLSVVNSERKDLKNALTQKELELEQKEKHLWEKESAIDARESLIKMLSEKDEEQANIIKLLKNKFQTSNQAECNFKRELSEKKNFIEKLSKKLDARNQQITEMEKIIITLEDQARKGNVQIKKDQEQIKLLLKKIAYFESYQLEIKRTIDGPSENLDSILKILEQEMDNDHQPSNVFNKGSELNCNLQNASHGDVVIKDRKHHLEHEKANTNLSLTSEPETKPKRIVMGNYLKNTYINKDNKFKKSSDSKIESNDAKFNISHPIPDFKNKLESPGNTILQPDSLSHNKDDEYILRNFQIIMPNWLREEKKNKMYKLAGHKLG